MTGDLEMPATTRAEILDAEPSAAHSPDELAALANASHRAASAHAHTAVECALRAGRALLLAKQQVAHGDWSRWLDENFQGSARTARRWMQVAKAIENGHTAELEPASVRALLAGTTDAATDADATDDRDRPAPNQVRQLIFAIRAAAVAFYERHSDQWAVELGETVIAEARSSWEDEEDWEWLVAVCRRIVEAAQRDGGSP